MVCSDQTQSDVFTLAQEILDPQVLTSTAGTGWSKQSDVSNALFYETYLLFLLMFVFFFYILFYLFMAIH